MAGAGASCRQEAPAIAGVAERASPSGAVQAGEAQHGPVAGQGVLGLEEGEAGGDLRLFVARERAAILPALAAFLTRELGEAGERVSGVHWRAFAGHAVTVAETAAPW